MENPQNKNKELLVQYPAILQLPSANKQSMRFSKHLETKVHDLA